MHTKKLLITLSLLMMITCGCSQASSSKNDAISWEISEAQAQKIVAQHIGKDEDELSSFTLSKEVSKGHNVYNIQTEADDKIYSYKISRQSGEVLSSSYEKKDAKKNVNKNQNDDNKISQKNEENTDKTTSSKPTQNTKDDDQTIPSSQKPSTTNTKPQKKPTTSISKNQAKSIALQKAGISSTNAKNIKVTTNQNSYTISFQTTKSKYQYIISKQDGKVIDSTKTHHTTSKPKPTTNQRLSTNQAIDLVLKKVPGASRNHIDIELEDDDDMLIYEGELEYGNHNYEFEIDAYTGTFLKWSVESEDDD